MMSNLQFVGGLQSISNCSFVAILKTSLILVEAIIIVLLTSSLRRMTDGIFNYLTPSGNIYFFYSFNIAD